jgi:hypothetical protein
MYYLFNGLLYVYNMDHPFLIAHFTSIFWPPMFRPQLAYVSGTAKARNNPISWRTRLDIALNAAEGCELYFLTTSLQ